MYNGARPGQDSPIIVEYSSLPFNVANSLKTIMTDDESNVLKFPTEPPTSVKTTWTLLIYLTGTSTGCVGGETVFYPDLGPAKSFSGKSSEESGSISIEPDVGMALLHKHGQDCLLHEGKRVEKGEKWVLRSDICVKR